MSKRSVFILSFSFIIIINYNYLYKCSDFDCVISNFILPVFFAMNNVEIFNFIKGDKFDILLAPHYNSVKKNINKKIRLFFFFVLILIDIGILVFVIRIIQGDMIL